jgi:hypothetical protein
MEILLLIGAVVVFAAGFGSGVLWTVRITYRAIDEFAAGQRR